MSLARKCDRCNEFYDETEKDDVIQISVDYGPEIGRVNLDLCDKCYLELRLWTAITKVNTARKRNQEENKNGTN